MGEKILSCPFCGYEMVDICRTNENACWVECVNCGGKSESAATREEAIANWNRRSNIPRLAQVNDDMDKEWEEWLAKIEKKHKHNHAKNTKNIIKEG